MQIRTAIVLLGIAAMAAGCAGDSDQDARDRTPSILAPKTTLRVKVLNQETLFYGDTLHLEIEPKDPTLTFEKVTLSLSDGKDALASNATGKFKLPTALTGGGRFKLKVEALLKNGEKAVRYKDFTVLAGERAKRYSFKLVRSYPHDVTSFTQGLLIHDGFLYEGTGNYRESRIRKMELSTGNVLMERSMSDDVFGEGITIFDGKVYQLTYKSSRGFIYDLATFDPLDEFTYDTYTTEGWGLTHNDTALIASDGSANLYFLDPTTRKEVGRLRVFNERGEVTRLNELEYYKGVVYANVYTTAEILAIDAATGQVIGEYTVRGLLNKADITSDMDVLNGIAINPLNGNMLITGKYWPKIYEVQAVPQVDS